MRDRCRSRQAPCLNTLISGSRLTWWRRRRRRCRLPADHGGGCRQQQRRLQEAHVEIRCPRVPPAPRAAASATGEQVAAAGDRSGACKPLAGSRSRRLQQARRSEGGPTYSSSMTELQLTALRLMPNLMPAGCSEKRKTARSAPGKRQRGCSQYACQLGGGGVGRRRRRRRKE